jgi:hypothetical protein
LHGIYLLARSFILGDVPEVRGDIVADHQAQGIPNNKLNAKIFGKLKNYVNGPAPAIWCSRLVRLH